MGATSILLPIVIIIIISPTILGSTVRMLASLDSSAPLLAHLFRGMTVAHNPNLLQELPAEKKYEIEPGPEFVALSGQMWDLKAEPPSEEREKRPRKL